MYKKLIYTFFKEESWMEFAVHSVKTRNHASLCLLQKNTKKQTKSYDQFVAITQVSIVIYENNFLRKLRLHKIRIFSNPNYAAYLSDSIYKISLSTVRLIYLKNILLICLRMNARRLRNFP